MLSPSSQAYQQVEACARELIEGLVVAIDPSIGSNSSMPGWAVYRRGDLIASGTFPLTTSGALPQRLSSLAGAMRKLYDAFPADVLVYEEIPVQRHGGNAASHASLLKAVGVIISVPGPDHYVGVYPVSWKKLARSSYAKSDEADAIEIGWAIIEEAKRISQRKKK